MARFIFVITPRCARPIRPAQPRRGRGGRHTISLRATGRNQAAWLGGAAQAAPGGGSSSGDVVSVQPGMGPHPGGPRRGAD
ncbi:MAG TPA: hypothetical protein VFH73_06615 [Polyangia bacterium]|nr:hypothetical protein [Polyangia bacterium]